MVKIEQVLNYWFGELNDELAPSEKAALWYQVSEETDSEIRAQFSSLYQQAISGELSHWQQTARGSLALVILLDQMSRNMFRGTARAFAADIKALAFAKAGIEQGFDRDMSLIERIFYYHPFEHSESLAEQKRSVELFSGLLDDYREPKHIDAIENALHWAREHLEIIERFGRFPHRNKLLNRESSDTEVEYLRQANHFGQGSN